MTVQPSESTYMYIWCSASTLRWYGVDRDDRSQSATTNSVYPVKLLSYLDNFFVYSGIKALTKLNDFRWEAVTPSNLLDCKLKLELTAKLTKSGDKSIRAALI